MKVEDFKELIQISPSYFEQINGDATVHQGWKLSIQGKTLEDILYLFENLINFLVISKCSFKFATKKLLTCEREEQRTKLLTVYIPDNVDAKSFAELVYLHIEDYAGGEGVIPKKGYEHYKNAIYYRNDRDENGEYIYPDK